MLIVSMIIVVGATLCVCSQGLGLRCVSVTAFDMACFVLGLFISSTEVPGGLEGCS